MGRRIAILVASSEFPHAPGLAKLLAPERDVDQLGAVLTQPHSGAFDKIEIVKNQTTQYVRELMNGVIEDASKDDLILIHYSGHGKLDYQGRLCLTMADTKLEKIQSTTFRVNELRDYIDNARCKNVVLLLDCCNSGAVGKSFARGDVADQMQALAGGGGIHIMSAAGSLQSAMESAEHGLGVFTRHVIDGLRHGDADSDEDGVISFDDLYQYVAKRVMAEGHQRPQRWVVNAAGSIEIAKTGRDVWQEKCARLRKHVIGLLGDRRLPSRTSHEAIRVLDLPKADLRPWQQRGVDLIEQLESGRLQPVQFCDLWEQLDHSDAVTTTPASFVASPDSARAELIRPPAEPPKPAPPDLTRVTPSTPEPALPTLGAAPKELKANLAPKGRTTRPKVPAPMRESVEVPLSGEEIFGGGVVSPVETTAMELLDARRAELLSMIAARYNVKPPASLASAGVQPRVSPPRRSTSTRSHTGSKGPPTALDRFQPALILEPEVSASTSGATRTTRPALKATVSAVLLVAAAAVVAGGIEIFDAMFGDGLELTRLVNITGSFLARYWIHLLVLTPAGIFVLVHLVRGFREGLSKPTGKQSMQRK